MAVACRDGPAAVGPAAVGEPSELAVAVEAEAQPVDAPSGPTPIHTGVGADFSSSRPLATSLRPSVPSRSQENWSVGVVGEAGSGRASGNDRPAVDLTPDDGPVGAAASVHVVRVELDRPVTPAGQAGPFFGAIRAVLRRQASRTSCPPRRCSPPRRPGCRCCRRRRRSSSSPVVPVEGCAIRVAQAVRPDLVDVRPGPVVERTVGRHGPVGVDAKDFPEDVASWSWNVPSTRSPMRGYELAVWTEGSEPPTWYGLDRL